MNFKNENQLLFIIRYGLFILIISFTLILTIFLYYKNETDLKKMKNDIEKKYILNEKQIKKEEIESVYNLIISQQKETEKELKKSLKSMVYGFNSLILDLYNQYKDKLSKKEFTLLIKTAIKNVRFNNGRGYFFVYDKTGKVVIHSLFPFLEGKNLINYQDVKNTFIIKERLKLLKNSDESFQKWYWRKSKTDKIEYEKLGFIKNIPELNWIIGTGEYVDDFESDIQKKILSQVSKIKFGANGYIFVFDKNNKYLLTIRKSAIGKNVLEQNNIVNIKNIIKNMEEKAQKGGFVEYTQKRNPITNKPTDKIAYVKFIPKWNWVIGSGFYKKKVKVSIEKEIKRLSIEYENSLRNILIFSFFLMIILLNLSYYISLIIERKFRNYKDSINLYIKENERQQELLSQKNKLMSMGEMLENIAHQWRQPLSVISTVSSGIRIQKEMNTLTDKFLIEGLDNIDNGTNYLTNTIEDFRDFFKPEKEKTIFLIKKAIDKTINLFLSKIKFINIEIIDDIEDIKIEGYESKLLQVLLNIIKNAIDALEYSNNEKYIFIKAYKKDKDLIIQIKDNAGGINKDIINRIFEPYFTTKHKSQGTGIGLYMSQEIITKHMNGRIEVNNIKFNYEHTTYKGVKFSIIIPTD